MRGKAGGLSRGRPTLARADGLSADRHAQRTPKVTQGSSADSRGASATICGTCKSPVGDDCIGCDWCDEWFHPKAICMGVAANTIQDIIRLSGEGISYVCLQCRVNKRVPSKSPASRRSTTGGDSGQEPDQREVVKQLAEMVTAMCMTVQTLVDKVDVISSRMDSFLSSASTAQSAAPLPSPAIDEATLDAKIRDQCRELRDRERRRRSVIIRGVPNTDVSGVCNIFQAVSNFLVSKDISIENLQCVHQEKGIYRADIPNDDDRRLLLNQTKRLKEHASYKSVYIHKDLTYTQRQELYRRREAARNTDNGASAPSSQTQQSSNIASQPSLDASNSAQGSNPNQLSLQNPETIPPVAPFQ